MIDPVEGGRILARLQAHFPNLAANPDAARDWLSEICVTPDPAPLVDWLIREWDRDRAPRVSDWVRARRTSVHQAAIAAAQDDRLAIDPPDEPMVPPARVRELLDDATRKLAQTKLDETRAPLVGKDRRPWSSLRHEDGAGSGVRMLTYDEVYGETAQDDILPPVTEEPPADEPEVSDDEEPTE